MNFKLTLTDNIQIIECPDLSHGDLVNKLSLEIKNWLLIPVDYHLLDFHLVKNIDSDYFPIFTKFNHLLTKHAKVLATINMSKSIHKEIRKNGLDNVFTPINNINELKKIKPK